MIQTRTEPIIVQVTDGLFHQVSHYANEKTPIVLHHMEAIAQGILQVNIKDFPISYDLTFAHIPFLATFTIGKDRPVLTMSQSHMN